MKFKIHQILLFSLLCVFSNSQVSWGAKNLAPIKILTPRLDKPSSPFKDYGADTLKRRV